jgi:hypothetical protein
MRGVCVATGVQDPDEDSETALTSEARAAKSEPKQHMGPSTDLAEPRYDHSEDSIRFFIHGVAIPDESNGVVMMLSKSWILRSRKSNLQVPPPSDHQRAA